MSPTHDNLFSPRRSSTALQVHLLGVVDFDSALLLQKHLVFEISGRRDRFGTLLLCEHPPLITIGREGSRGDVEADEHELTARQLDVRFLNRGGGALVHAPGQLAAYPILPLDRLGIGLQRLRTGLEDAAIAAAGEVHASAVRAERPPGASCRCGQFAFVGAAVKSCVSYHGLFVNVNPRMDLMRLARPGDSVRTTSLSAQRVRPTSMHAVRESLARHLATQFGYEHVHFHTGHPLLKRTRRKVHVYA